MTNILRSLTRNALKLLGKTKRVDTPISNYKLNIKPSPEDERDEIYAVFSLNTYDLPPRIDLSSYCTPVKNQGEIGSCGSHAYATAIEMLCAMNDEAYDELPLSELFHYYNVRSPDYMNTLPEDSGQFLRDGAKAAQKIGIAPETLWAYKPSKFNDKPPIIAYWFANLWRISSYGRCRTADDIRVSLERKKPVVFGIKVLSNIYATDKSGDLNPGGRGIGGHALTAVGYDDYHKNPDGTVGAINFINSWGKNWGDNGYGWISYTRLEKDLIEAWSVSL